MKEKSKEKKEQKKKIQSQGQKNKIKFHDQTCDKHRQYEGIQAIRI